MKTSKTILALAAALAAAAPFAAEAASPCGCFMPSTDHLNTWSNIVEAADAASRDCDDAKAALEDAKTAWEGLSKKKADLEALLAAYRGIETDYRRIESQISPSMLEEKNPDRVKSVLESLKSAISRCEDADKKWAAAVETDGGWAELKRRADISLGKIDESAGAFGNDHDLARRHRGHGIDWPCVRQVYSSRVEPTEKNMKSLGAARDAGKAKADDDARRAADLQAQVEALRENVAAFPGLIAQNRFRVSGISDAERLKQYLEEQAVPRVSVRFRSAGALVPDGEKSLRRGLDPVRNDINAPYRTGFSFFGWRDRDAGKMFDGWGKPVEDDLNLEAVWGHRVSVAGLDGPFEVVVRDGELPPSLSKVLLDPRFEAFKETLAAPAGKKLVGWRNFETKAPVDGATPVDRSFSVEPVWEDIVYAISWFDGDGATFIDETKLGAGDPARARALPDDRDGFHYLHWSATVDGDRWTGFGKPLDGDVSLYAVRDADHTLSFALSNGTTLDSRGFREGQVFTAAAGPEAPAQKGLVFVGWFDEQGRDFSGQKVVAPRKLLARYRRETFGEFVERVFRPLEAKFPLPLVAVADVVLMVLFFVLKPAGKKRGRNAAHAHDHAHDHGHDDGAAAEAPDAAVPEAGASAAKALALALALLPALASAADAAGAAADAAPPFDPMVLLYPALLVVFALFAALDVLVALARVGNGFASLVSAIGRRGGSSAAAASAAPEKETCPTCGVDLVDGECPSGHTIVRCSKCASIMKDGVCPKCGVGGEQEFCPTCNSELVDGECPRGHTIVRCPDCGSILQEGVCPKGCNADPLNLGWPGGMARTVSAFALKVLACPKTEGVGFELRVPESFIVGRSSTDAKEPFVELLTVTRKEKAQCSRQYVRFERGGAGAAFTVTLLNSSRNPAFVDGRKLVMQNDAAPLSLGGTVKLNPGYELQLVEAAPEEG